MCNKSLNCTSLPVPAEFVSFPCCLGSWLGWCDWWGKWEQVDKRMRKSGKKICWRGRKWQWMVLRQWECSWQVAESDILFILYLMFIVHLSFSLSVLFPCVHFLYWGATVSVCVLRPREMFFPKHANPSLCPTVKTVYHSLQLVTSILNLTWKQNKLCDVNEVYDMMKQESLTRNCDCRLVPHHGWKRN